MSALASTLRLELRLQKRYGFLYAAAFSGALWLALMLPLPHDLRDVVAPYAVFGDLVIVGFFFIAGSLFFEKGARTVFALVVTPLSFRDYLTAKVSSLTALSTVMALAIVLVTHGTRFSAPELVLGVVLATVLFLLVSFASAAPYPSITDWIIPATLWIGVLSVPFLSYSGLWEHALVHLVPTMGPLLLLGAAFGQHDLAGWEWAYALLYPVLWIAVLGLVSRWVFDHHIVAGEGR
ncbi:fluoroquinolone export ABC transporter permease subunit [Halostreptopolyspora alba]|uniref:Fluoroquinolone transporter permease n=1 Tax=Halostreptopolyspora alba TaxID=2487137 RepID=A0A3N0EIC9_9ACTN|nr:fluoroquinolone transporter permease [Nocardiopsaceae bacterium YIM 96095]